MKSAIALGYCLASLTIFSSSRSYAMSQEPDAGGKGRAAQTSQREKKGLRGSVSAVEEEMFYPSVPLADRSQTLEVTQRIRTEYDRDGRIVEVRSGGTAPGAQWATRYTYSPAGMLLKISSGRDGETESESVYRYDDQDRLQSITSSGRPDPIVFRYDASGKKSKLAVVRPPANPPQTGASQLGAVSMSVDSLFENPQASPALADGGSAITLYDEKDRPTEVQLYRTDGSLISRVVRVYDNAGNVLEERQRLEDPLKMIPEKQLNEMLSRSGASAQELRDQLTSFLGTTGDIYSVRYSYDSQGRQTSIVRAFFGRSEERTETSYNDHGDPVRQTTHSTQMPQGEEPASQSDSETLYSYDYDANGNWISRKTYTRTLPAGEPRISAEAHRSIEYY